MPSFVTQLPERANFQNAGQISRWNASRHPYLFKVLRIDAVILNYVNNGGFLQINIDGVYTNFSTTTVGSTVFVGDSQGLYNLAGTVTQVLLSGTPTFSFVTDITYLGIPSFGGYINTNELSGYNFEVTLSGFKPTAGGYQNSIWGTWRIYPDKYGYGIIDCQEFINDYVQKRNAFKYNLRVWRDIDVFGYFQVSYIAKWSGNSEAKVSIPYLWWFVDATKYIQERYGQNMGEYHPYYVTGILERAKFLTDFPKPTYWRGLPFDLSFIFPDALTTTQGLTTNEQLFTNSGATIITNNYGINLNKQAGVHRLMLEPSVNNLNYPSNTEELDFWINGGDIPQLRYVEPYYVSPNYVSSPAAVPLPTIRISEKKRIKVREACDNLFFVSWRNSKGGWSYWAFQKRQEYQTQAKVEGIIGKEPQDLEYAEYRDIPTNVSLREKVLVGAVVQQEDIVGLKFLESSPMIQYLLNPYDTINPPKWRSLNINPKGVKYRTDGYNTEVEFEFYFPDYYTISN